MVVNLGGLLYGFERPLSSSSCLYKIALPWLVVGTVAHLGVHLGAIGSYGGSSRGCRTLRIIPDATTYGDFGWLLQLL